MSRRYEDEIRDLLKGMDRFPGEGGRPRRPRGPAWWTRLASDDHRLMGGALLLILCAWVLGGPWSPSFPFLVMVAGVAQVAGIVLFVIAFARLYRRGAFAGGVGQFGSRGSATRWRGQVIEMPRRRSWIGSVRASFATWLRRRMRRRPPAGRW